MFKGEWGKNLSNKTKDLSRAIESIREEIEAVDYYTQRAENSEDEQLKEIFLHNAKEEKEHAAMLIEWVRRNDETGEWNDELKDYVFTEGEIGH